MKKNVSKVAVFVSLLLSMSMLGCNRKGDDPSPSVDKVSDKTSDKKSDKPSVKPSSDDKPSVKPSSDDKPSVKPSVHTHEFDSAWSHDDNQHWHACKGESCTERKDVQDHTLTWTTMTAEGVHTDKVEKGVCSVCGFETERNVENTGIHQWGEEWKKDETGHWHETTCTGHDVMKREFAEHSGTWTVKSEATTLKDKVEERNCAVCGFHEERTVEGTKIPKKERALTVKETTFVYDGNKKPIDDYIECDDKTGMTIVYRLKGSVQFYPSAPRESGDFEYKITIPENDEYVETVKTGEFRIAKYRLTLDVGEFEKELGASIVDDDIVLKTFTTTIAGESGPLQVKLVIDKSYDVPGTNEIPLSDLKTDDPNFVIDTGSFEKVTLKVFDTADFYCGIKDIFTLSGSTDVIVDTTIARGTLKKGDSLVIPELGKTVTVNKMAQNRVNLIDKVTVGDEVTLSISGVTKAELSRGFILCKADTIEKKDRFKADVYLLKTEESGRKTPLVYTEQGTMPSIYFGDTFTEKIARMYLPSTLEDNWILPGQTATDVIFEIPGGISNLLGRNFTIREGGKTIARGVVKELHDHDEDFDKTGICSACGYSRCMTGTLTGGTNYDSGELGYLAGESRYFNVTLRSGDTYDIKYRIFLSNGTGFSYRMYKISTGEEVKLTSGKLVVPPNSDPNYRFVVKSTKGGTTKLSISIVIEIIKPGL